ncbi:MAG: methyltransferase domain-containing protein, partial [Dehalococcoidales bacterium]|nr:methyltransferase domain-containing protein [Dehalococcoidales bacterium]
PYTKEDVRRVEPPMLAKWFTIKPQGYTVADKLRYKVDFRHFTLLNDSFESGFDLIACRNVIIYFSDVSRNRLFQQFHRALKPGGILFLGGSEVILKPADYGFEMVFPFFYMKLPVTSNRI